MTDGTGEPAAQPEQPFDPYRYGKPDYPIPPEYAPPGYVPDVPPPAQPPPPHPFYGPTPYASMPSPYAGGPPPQGYPQYPSYPQPPYPPYPPPPSGYRVPITQTNGMAVAGMWCGIVGLLIAGIVLGPLAIIFGSIGLQRAKSGAPGHDKAVAGIVLGVLDVIVFVIVLIYVERHGGFTY